jgi:hypothetical protein
MRRLLFVLLLSSAPAHAADWGERDTAMLGGALGLMAIDWAQTLDIARQTKCAAAVRAQCASVPAYRETNPVLPTHPSASEVNRYFVLAMVGTVGISYALTPTYRRYFLGGVLLIEGVVVFRNHQIGVRASF